MGKKKIVWRRVDDIVPLAPHGHSSRMMRGVDAATDAQHSSYASRSTMLTKSQMKRLRAVMSDKLDVHGRGNFPVIECRLIDLIICLRENLSKMNVSPRCVKLNGGAASFVASSDDFAYADVDLIFTMSDDECDEDGSAETNLWKFDSVRDAVFATIRQMMPDNIGREKFGIDALKDAYLRKMIKVSTDHDRWSLFSLNNDYGKCIELKFVDRMRRQFEFSVDSFQIDLQPLIENFEKAEHKMVSIESMFGDVHQAMNHLHERLIDTIKPEEIRGGGLLKYCHLIIRGYKAARPGMCRKLERYMCSRFFIDFPDIMAQEQKLINYLESHFGARSDQWSSSLSSSWGDDTDSEASTSQATTSTSSILATGQAKYDFLLLLYRVISESTVCLMHHERQMTLNMIDRLAFEVSMQTYSTQAFSTTSSSSPPRTTLFYLPADASNWIRVV